MTILDPHTKIKDLETRLKKLEAKDRSLLAGDYYARFMSLHNLRGFWGMSSTDLNNLATYDQSGQGRFLGYNGGLGGATRIDDNYSCVDLNGTTHFLSRATEAGLNLVNHLYAGGWFSVDALNCTLMSKWDAGANQRSWALQLLASGAVRVALSSNGVLQPVFDTAAGLITVGNHWNFIMCRYETSTAIDIFVGSSSGYSKTNLTTSIPAAIFGSTAPFLIGALGTIAVPASFFNGRASLCFLGAAGAGGLTDNRIRNMYYRGKPFFQP